MLTTSVILAGLLAAAISGISGYLISFRFNRSNYAATDRSGDFGAPRGGFFALASGMMIGILFFSLISHVNVFTPDAISAGFFVSMFVGVAAGIAGMIRGQKARTPNNK